MIPREIAPRATLPKGNAGCGGNGSTNEGPPGLSRQNGGPQCQQVTFGGIIPLFNVIQQAFEGQTEVEEAAEMPHKS